MGEITPGRPSVLVTFDSMKYVNTGLYHFGKSLGEALIRQNDRFNLTYYLHKRGLYFKDKVNTLTMAKYHKLYFPRSRDFDVVHVTDQIGRLDPKKVKAGKIMTLHDLNFLHETAHDEKKLSKQLDALANMMGHFDRIVTISHFVRRDVLSYFPEMSGKVTVIHNGADKLVPFPGHQPAYRPQKPFLFTIGLVSSKKNFHVLPALLARNDFELVIAGIETPYQEKVMEQARTFNCADRVKIIGTISDNDKTWYFKNCQAFVFPSLAEGFGLPVIEAMHFGKPVFLSDKTSLPEVGGDSAWYFTSFEPEAMQQVFETGMNNFESNNLEEKVIRHAQKFSWDAAALSYLQLYSEYTR
ncbi:glycosyltransferase family 4 protein [Hufsiella ginkgonis]|uniref:Glycosyltransferase n=1 Tax=Hufsiella ginkgonis TaxID=2695274 RepID=A0A7K1XSM4_9SPHI|nr:glycosyltransferase family 1 protein [Hufsiella ginkgonis]MXV13952.1 glycosyltransferase [Hufsiella ginkgonis]